VHAAAALALAELRGPAAAVVLGALLALDAAGLAALGFRPPALLARRAGRRG
jgi:hypothetical protein